MIAQTWNLKLVRILVVFSFLAGLACFQLQHALPASAEVVGAWDTGEDLDGDGQSEFAVLWKDLDGDFWVGVYILGQLEWFPLGSPDPDGAEASKELSDMIDLAKQGGGEVVLVEDFWNSPAGKAIGSGGGGPGAVWNPNEDGSGVPNPKAGIDEVEVIDFSAMGETSTKDIEHDSEGPGKQIEHGTGSGTGTIITGGNRDNDDIDQGPGKDDPEWWKAGPVAPKVNPPTVKQAN